MEATFCFVDLSGYTALTEAHGAETAADLVSQFTALVGDALAGDGRLVDLIGDAVFVVAPTPLAAVRFVVRLFNAATQQADFLVLRAGLHHGEALERDGHLFGASVNLAARVAALARGGQVLATAEVAAAAQSEGIEVSTLGPFTLRNVRDPVEIHALNVSCCESADVVDPVCRMRVQPDRAAGRLHSNGVDYWFCSLRCAAQFAANPEPFTRQ